MKGMLAIMSNIKMKEHIYNEVLKEMPAGLNEKEIAAFLMKKMGEVRSFSSKYYWSDASTREKIYNLCTNKNTKIRENKKQLICVTATRMYNELAQRLGLNTYIMGDTKITKNNYKSFFIGEHIYPVIKTKDGELIKADIEWDMANIQLGRKWIKFGTKDEEGQDFLTVLPQEELDNIMKKIGYIRSEEEYLENYIEKLELSNENIPLKNRVHRLFNDDVLTKRVSKLGSSVDIFRFYRSIVQDYITNNGEVTLYGGYSNRNKRSPKKYAVLAYFEDENNNDEFQAWSDNFSKLLKISKSDLKQFIDKGWLSIVAGKKTKEKRDRMLEKINNDKENNIINATMNFKEILTR